MTRILAALASAGLVERAPRPTDRRQVRVSLTERALAMADEDRRRRTEWLTARLAELDPAERAVLAAAAPILDRLAHA